MIMPCTCKHPFQDSEYGTGNRAHNQCKFDKSSAWGTGARCTVCGTVKRVGQ